MENNQITIRMETPADHETVHEVVKSAFLAIKFYENEDKLVERLRKTSAFIPELSLVAGGEPPRAIPPNGGGLAILENFPKLESIVGHILFTEIAIGEHIAVCLAPVAVLPEYQKRGIGGMLIEAGHKTAAELGYKLSLLVGHAEYYPRFGYERASKYGITQPFPAPDECVMVKWLADGERAITGKAVFPPEFY